MTKNDSEFQMARQVLLELLSNIVESDREFDKNNPDLWKIYVDNAIERIEWIFKSKKGSST